MNFKNFTEQILSLTLCSAIVVASSSALAAGAGNTGGGCYNLNIIALKTKTADMTGTSGHSMFVVQGGRTQIDLKEGAFSVLDRNGTDGKAAFQLPNPDPAGTGVLAYSVFARLVGKPSSSLDMSTCGVDELGVTYCSENILSMKRISGTSRFQNVSQELLTVQADIDGDGDIDVIPLFNDALATYFWQLDSQGRMHAQLRFCPLSK